MNDIIEINAAILAAVCIMIVHELPKALVYHFRNHNKIPLKNICNITQYIDPIGLLFATMTTTGFSKPYQIQFESKRKMVLIGLTGYFSLFCSVVTGILLYRLLFVGMDTAILLESNNYSLQFVYYFICFFTVNSMGMFFLNLFPLASFDMGMCIAGLSFSGFITILRNDTLIKLVLLVVLYIESIPKAVIQILDNVFQLYVN